MDKPDLLSIIRQHGKGNEWTQLRKERAKKSQRIYET